MAKAQITLPDGIKLTLEGTPDEIAATMARLQGGKASQPGNEAKTRGPKGKGQRLQLQDLLVNLVDSGFFKKPKDLAAVKAALEEMGHHYPVTTLSPTLLRWVRRRNLRRIKQDKRWMYTG